MTTSFKSQINCKVIAKNDLDQHSCKILHSHGSNFFNCHFNCFKYPTEEKDQKPYGGSVRLNVKTSEVKQ